MRHPEWLPAYLSVSQVNCYLLCPRKYLFRYVERLEPEQVATPLVLGSAVHATIAWAIDAYADGLTFSPDDLARTWRADWQAETDMPGVELEPDEAHGLCELGLKLVEAGLNLSGAGRVPSLRAEVEVGCAIWDPVSRVDLPVPLKGYLDFEGEGFLGEIKTVSRKTSWKHWSLQLSAYAFAWSSRYGRQPEVRVITLQKGKEVTASEERLVVAREEISWSFEVIAGAYHSLTRSAFHPTPSFHCMSCEFRRACRS